MINKAGLDLIREWEGRRLTAYRDAGGVWTIGYGHTAAAGDSAPKRGMRITADEAERILARDLGQYELAVLKALTRPMNDNQFAACVSLCFNIGPEAFTSSTLVKRWNSGNSLGAADAFSSWVKVKGQPVKGLVNRRRAERALFLALSNRRAPPWTAEGPTELLPDEGADLTPLPETAPTSLLGRLLGLLVAAAAAFGMALWQWWHELLVTFGVN